MGTKSGQDGALDVAILVNDQAASASNPLPVAVASGGGSSATGAAVPASAVYNGYNSGGNLVGVSSSNPMPVTDGTNYVTPDGRQVREISNAVILFSDDFGGSAVNTASRWDVLDGGLTAGQALPSSGQSLPSQGAIGTGTHMGNGVNGAANTALAVSASALTVTMGTTNGAELWLLSQQAFAGTEDLFFTFNKSASLTANSVQVGLVEVDPTTLVPLLNPNLANAFTNAGVAEMAATASGSIFGAIAIADSSGAYATGGSGTALQSMQGGAQEFLIEYHAEDIIVSTGLVDNAGAKSASPARVSSQVPNDGKVYKLLIRLRNTSTPGSSTTVTFGRVMLWNSQELRVEVASGRGDANAQKAVAVNIASGSVSLTTEASGSPKEVTSFLNATGTPAAQAVSSSSVHIVGGQAWNNSANPVWLKLWNTASTGVTVGTTAAYVNIMIPANSVVNLADVAGAFGLEFSTACSFALTGGASLTDSTAIGSAGVAGVTIQYQ